MIRSAGFRRILVDMTVSEHLEQNSFAYDAQFPPDCAAGKPLSDLRRERPAHGPAVRRALKRLVGRRR
jgi:hypothetical protein